MLIKSGSGLAGTAEASSAGVSKTVAQETIVLELGDEEGVTKCLQENAHEIAAIIIEPLPANYGLLIQEEKFLSFLRKVTTVHNVLLIFVEVSCGFRIGGIGGMAQASNIHPDIVTYGKVIGGGLPVGAIAGKAQIMDHLAPNNSLSSRHTEREPISNG